MVTRAQREELAEIACTRCGGTGTRPMNARWAAMLYWIIRKGRVSARDLVIFRQSRKWCVSIQQASTLLYKLHERGMLKRTWESTEIGGEYIYEINPAVLKGWKDGSG